MRNFILLLVTCFVVCLHAQTSHGLTPDQINQLQEYALRKGIKADFSKAAVDSLDYEKVEQSIDSLAILPDKVLLDWEFIQQERDYFLLLQAEHFTKPGTKILEEEDTEGTAFQFRSYLVSDTTHLFPRFKPDVRKEMRAVRILQSWPVSRLEHEYRGRGVNPYNQPLTKVLSRLLEGNLFVEESSDEGRLCLRYGSQPLYLIMDNPSELESSLTEYVLEELFFDSEDAPDLHEVKISNYTLPMLHNSVEYSLRNLQWIILADVSGKNAFLFISSEIPRIRLPQDEMLTPKD